MKTKIAIPKSGRLHKDAGAMDIVITQPLTVI